MKISIEMFPPKEGCLIGFGCGKKGFGFIFWFIGIVFFFGKREKGERLININKM